MNAVVGEDVLLLVHGPAHTNRETIYSNGSLLFQNVTLNDTGMYTVQITYAAQPSQVASGNISVYPILTKPNITSNDSNPKEDMDSVTLLCGLDLQDASYMWFRDNQTLPEDDRLQLSQNNWNLTLHNVTRNDTGLYECRTWNPVSDLRSDPFLLNVLYGPDTPTISPSDSYYPPGATLNLSCQAASNPPAQYFWFINGSYEQAAQNLIIPNITVNNSGNYTCQAYNSATDSNTTTSKLITVSEFVTMPYIDASNTTVTENSGPVVLKCFTNHTNIRWIFNMQSLQLTDRMTLSPNNDTLTIDPVKKEDAGDYQCEVYNQVSNKISDPIRLTVNPSASGSSGLSGGAIAGIVIGVVAGVALLAALVYFVFIRRSGGCGYSHLHR
ncbi:cell adhesion molecule CEACAM1-like [Rhynchocyon petersi]